MRRTWTLRAARAIPVAAFALLFLFHFYLIFKYAVDVPFLDDWHLLRKDGLPAGFSLSWLFAFHNEHRIVPTKLIYLLSLHATGLDLRILQLLNFALYGLLLLFVAWFAKRIEPQLPVWVLFGFLIFLLSPFINENHLWAFQSSFHLSLLFFLAAVYFLFCREQRARSLLAGAGLAILCCYSLASGMASGLVLLLMFSLFKLSRLFSAPDRAQRWRELGQLSLVVVPLLAAQALWFVGFQRPGSHPSLALPYTLSFWKSLAGLVSLGFGFSTARAGRDAFYFLLVLAPLVGGLWRARGRMPVSLWAISTVILGLIGCLSSIAVGRANMGPGGRFHRYGEMSMMLIPFSVLAWSFFLKDKARLKTVMLVSLWLFCAFGFRHSWSLFSVYGRIAQARSEGIECLKNYYEHGGEAVCPRSYPYPLAEPLEAAKDLNLSFYQKIQDSKTLHR
jgi:hypothetical protein